MSGKDRSERVRFKRTIKYGEGEPTEFGYAYELSEHGIAIFTDNLIDSGTKLVIEILLGNEFVNIEGEVRWSVQDTTSSAYRTGVKITKNDPRLEKTYERIKITRHAKTFY